MLVHSCIVDDGKGDTVRILDSEGCAIDRHLLNNLEYPSDLTAGQEAHVYKYADRSHMFYQCQISVTIKERNFECVRPKCAEPKGYGAKKSRNVKSVSSTDGYHAKIASTGNLSVSNSETSRLSPLSALVKRSAKIDQPENIWDVSADFEALDIFDMDSSQQFDLNRNLLSVYHYPTITIKATTDSTCLPFSSILILIFLIFLPSTFSAVFFILVRKYKKTLKTRRL
ncbi:hypothetical protein AB6A40_010069 [Gnathostoma spinigerum]|uniref:ZP domain-containing protein n=1 Tax=Gnathostoma spinigerum TaxID=75299 RepID=A0ABD6ETQ9_9BILA